MNELQDIVHKYGEEYRKEHSLPLNQLKALSSIEACRTSLLGGHIDECEECGHVKISYNSCRNRHCPKCQSLAKEQWLENRKSDLLPIRYFHVVFTLPEEINALALRNQKEIYKILFKAASETLLELARKPKYIGAQLGFTALLHTWGQNLMFHPHLHCIVPSGGLSIDGVKWISSRKKFFIPVRVLSVKFKGRFLYLLLNEYYNNRLKFVAEIAELARADIFRCLIERLQQKNWIVYCKPPIKTAAYMLQYLGRYTHRVAISNNRIEHIENGFVTFKWRDYKDRNKEKHMTISAEELIRRFLMHILPERFVKIRHFGILGNRNKKTKLEECKKLTGAKLTSIKKLSMEEVLLKLTGLDIRICPCCKAGKMIRRSKILPSICSPP
ncbi:IS91 family transposase [Candidatus Clostridium stratigraminis]|uniref:IS91 family transposase n=1 Tax=Candidatus Clostridium stratigraminis TaxID=3381661 RepID=A0ABW8T0W9_9CLOT